MDTLNFKRQAISLLNNKELLLTKRQLLQQLDDQLIALGAYSFQKLRKYDIKSPSPKLSRGENYRGLPYRIIDYPRIFQPEHVFAFRTLFWWGNYVSCTLHLKGSFMNGNTFSMISSLPSETTHNTYLSYSGDEWNHCVFDNNYQLLQATNLSSVDIKNCAFLKVSRLLHLEEINNLEAFYQEAIHSLLIPYLNGKH